MYNVGVVRSGLHRIRFDHIKKIRHDEKAKAEKYALSVKSGSMVKAHTSALVYKSTLKTN